MSDLVQKLDNFFLEVDNDDGDDEDDEDKNMKSRSFSRPFAHHAGNPHFWYLCYSKNSGEAALLLTCRISLVLAAELVFHATFFIR